jgi:hypothetical protein
LRHGDDSTSDIRSLRTFCRCFCAPTATIGLGMALNSAMRVCARVQIQVCPEPPLVFSHELLSGLRTGFQVVFPLRIACVFLHVERGRSSKRVWRSHRIIYLQGLAGCLHSSPAPSIPPIVRSYCAFGPLATTAGRVTPGGGKVFAWKSAYAENMHVLQFQQGQDVRILLQCFQFRKCDACTLSVV